MSDVGESDSGNDEERLDVDLGLPGAVVPCNLESREEQTVEDDGCLLCLLRKTGRGRWTVAV